MACDPKLRKLAHLTARKQLGQVRSHHAGDGDKQLTAARQFVRQANHARQHAGNFDDRDVILAAKRIPTTQAHDEVQRLIGHLRKRM